MIYAENILVCILIPLLVSLLFISGSARRFTLSFSLGMIVCLISAYVSGFIELAGGMDPGSTPVYISPIVEEIMKMLPILFGLFVLKLDGKMLFVVAAGIGSGFATFENCCQILTEGAGSFLFVLIRGLAVGIMHIVCMLVLTLCLILAQRFKALSFPSALGALSLSMIYHGLYNLLVSSPGISSYIGYAMPVITAVFLYMAYRKYSTR